MISLPAQIAAAAVACIIAAAGGVKLGLTLKQGQWDAARVSAQETMQAAQAGAAAEIAKLEVKNVTIRQAIQREIVTKEVFRDCRSGPLAVSLLNDAAGHPDRPASAGNLPESSAAD